VTTPAPTVVWVTLFGRSSSDVVALMTCAQGQSTNFGFATGTPGPAAIPQRLVDAELGNLATPSRARAGGDPERAAS
jgi:hypothetical protein